MSKSKMRCVITVVTKVNPTESVEKVETAIRRVLGEIDLKRVEENGHLFLESRVEGSEALKYFKEQLKRQRIRDAARSFLSSRSEESSIAFGLNKQAAYMGRISFYHPQESPLGPIQIEISGDTGEIINFLCNIEAERPYG
ncbi:MAG: RNA-binding domain-containing protein [Candidatus Bathyarchaeia archaeon]